VRGFDFAHCAHAALVVEAQQRRNSLQVERRNSLQVERRNSMQVEVPPSSSMSGLHASSSLSNDAAEVRETPRMVVDRLKVCAQSFMSHEQLSNSAAASSTESVGTSVMQATTACMIGVRAQ
jgi:hypothetical protein